MLFKRILTAGVGIPAAIFIINYGQWLYGLTISLLAFVAWHEYVRMMKYKQIKVSNLLGGIGIGALIGCAWVGNPSETVAVSVLITMAVLTKMVLSYHTFSLADAAFTFAGFLYIGLSFSHLVMLRFLDSSLGSASGALLPFGALYLWLAFLGTWASDTFAYFVGSKFGRTKLAPAISPSKTREGATGGLVGCIFTVIVFGNYFNIPLVHLFFLGLVVGITAPVGDLVQSVIKRYVGIKDSGNFFPGHGGVLDRFDSIMFAVPAVYYYLQIFLLR